MFAGFVSYSSPWQPAQKPRKSVWTRSSRGDACSVGSMLGPVRWPILACFILDSRVPDFLRLAPPQSRQGVVTLGSLLTPGPGEY
ncbi:hypothetical protein VTN77DRAFT_9052 [Rasamsonia byssochlamydoides]|uniref:uncharacterized protein n=1 Tax=Rasamsonia byssochlamydoides TaxID=89139 RepID=UPI003744653F